MLVALLHQYQWILGMDNTVLLIVCRKTATRYVAFQVCALYLKQHIYEVNYEARNVTSAQWCVGTYSRRHRHETGTGETDRQTDGRDVLRNAMQPRRGGPRHIKPVVPIAAVPWLGLIISKF